MSYKLVARNKDTKRQIKKWVYPTRRKYMVYSPDIIARYANTSYLGENRQVEVYQLNDDEEWDYIATYNGDD